MRAADRQSVGNEKSAAGLAAYIRRARAEIGARRLLTGVGATLAASLTEGLGLALLVPMLALVDGQANQGTSGKILSALGVAPTLPVVTGVFAALIVARSVLVWTRDRISFAIQLDFVDRLRRSLFGAIANARWPVLAARRQSDTLSILTQDIARVSVGTTYVLSAPPLAAMAIVNASLAAFVSPALTLGAAALALALFFFTRRFAGRAHARGRETSEANREAAGAASDLLAGLKLVRAYGAGDAHLAEYGGTLDRMRAGALRFQMSNTALRAAIQIGGALALSAVILVAGEFLRLHVADLVLLVVAFARSLPLVNEAQQARQQIAYMLPAFASAMEIEAECLASAEPAAAPGAPPLELTSEIRLEDIVFSYDPPRGPRVLDHFNAAIPAGGVTALVGASGAGKSTLADIVMGLLEPDSGRVLVDGVELGPDLRARWRASIGWVPQENFLFNGSIRANLQWASPTADDAEIAEALRLAAADAIVAALPQGLDTMVGDRGARFSGGERQRLALARALLRRPSLLVLDEATNAVDADNEKLILDAIDKLAGKTTILAIAHSEAVMSRARQVLRLSRPAAGAASAETAAGGDFPASRLAL